MVDDGAKDKIPPLDYPFKYVPLRAYDSGFRASNMAIRRGFDESDGDFIITNQPEVLIPYDAIENMITLADMNRRNVATQFHLTFSQWHNLRYLSGWEIDFDKIKSISNFMSTETPWGYPNLVTHTHRNHFSFSGSTRERFEEYMIPATEVWGVEDAYVHVKELERGEPSLPIDIEIYHQEHERVGASKQEYSVRIQRIRESEFLI